MPIDLQQCSITYGVDVSVTLPQVTFSAVVVDSRTQATKQDVSGAKSLVFPAVVSTLSAAEKKELMETLIVKIVEIKLRGLS